MSIYSNNPLIKLDYIVDYNPENLSNNIIEVIKQIITYKDYNNINFKVEHLTGGNTNILYLITPEVTNEIEQYIVRLYGLGTEDFIDRQIENTIFAELSKSGISPKFLGLFSNGRVEGYINARSLSPDEFSDIPIGRSIAKAMANFQHISIDIDRNVGLWNKLHVFFSLAKDNIAQNRLPKLNSYSIQLDQMSQEAVWLERTVEEIKNKITLEVETSDYIKGKQFAYEVVLCHNDVLSGNVLLHATNENSQNVNETIFQKIPQNDSEADPKVTLIDYEYSCYSYRAFDIANHFCEYAGFLFDIKNKFPTELHRKEWERQFILQSYQLQQRENVTISDEFLNGFDEIIMKFVLVSHLFWGSWAVIQAAHSLIDFDFLEYAQKRFEGYYYHKEMINFESEH